MRKISKPLAFTITLVLALLALSVGNSYWFIVALSTGWLFYDTQIRYQKNWIGWILATVLLSPLAVAFYLPQRNLKPGEKREGGYVWNLSKNFSLLWTLVMLSVAFMSLGNIASTMSDTTNDFELAGAGLGAALGLGLIFGLWFMVVITALIIGLLMRKPIIEEGPTGELAIVNQEE